MLRTAQIGLGWWGSQVTKVLKGSEKIEIVCGVDPVPAIAEKYTAGPRPAGASPTTRPCSTTRPSKRSS